MIELKFVSKNRHKFEEIINLIRSTNYHKKIRLVMSDLPKIEIQSSKIEDIVTFAANYLIEKGEDNLIIEDAGLFIDTLGGFPGPYSSYVYKTIGNEGILKLMEDKTNRRAYFISVIGLVFKRKLTLFRGGVSGIIAKEMRGSLGFGFDPIFIPEGTSKTFAEMNIIEKNKYSHRAKALNKLLGFISNL